MTVERPAKNVGGAFGRCVVCRVIRLGRLASFARVLRGLKLQSSFGRNVALAARWLRE